MSMLFTQNFFKLVVFPCVLCLLLVDVTNGNPNAKQMAYANQKLEKEIVFDDDLLLRKAIKLGYDINYQNDKGDTLLHSAIRHKSTKIIEYILKIPNLDINLANKAGETALMLAIWTDMEDLANRLLDHPQLEVNKKGWTPLHYAAWKGNVAIIEKLLDKSAFVDAWTPNDTTPLMLAAREGHDQAVKVLLREGADPLLVNQINWSALDFAKQGMKGHTEELIENAMKDRKAYLAQNPPSDEPAVLMIPPPTTKNTSSDTEPLNTEPETKNNDNP